MINLIVLSLSPCPITISTKTHVINMKTFLLFFLALLSNFILSQENRVVPLFNTPETQSGDYLKDIDGDLKSLVGIWRANQGEYQILIQFELVEKIKTINTTNFNQYEDVLYGAYEFKINGQTVYNSLPLQLNSDKLLPISGNIIGESSRVKPPCPNCSLNYRGVLLSLIEPENPHLHGRMRIAYFIHNGTEKLQVLITNTLNENNMVGFSGQKELKIPEGLYTFEKVN